MATYAADCERHGVDNLEASELRYRRGAMTTPQGWFATDVDFSGRRLVAGMNESLALFSNSIGRVDIVEYAED